MKTTTTSSQSPTPPSVGSSIVQIPSAAAVALHNQQTKNKRKNFNPRCSTSADENDMNASTTVVDSMLATAPNTTNSPSSPTPSNPPPSTTHQNISPTPITIRNSPFKFEGDPRIAFEAMSINWRKLLESQQTHQSNEFRNFENNKFYNIPNTNFSIAKSAFAAAAAAAQQTPVNMATGEASDPHSRIEFACNAFNAMQELLNVYGLSISPADIVDAFKKQAAGE